METGHQIISIEEIQPLKTGFSLQKIKPEKTSPTRLYARTRIMEQNPLIAVTPEFQLFNTSIIQTIHHMRDNVFHITTESGSVYEITIGDVQSESK